MQEIRGTGVALVTPFNEDMSIDYTGLKNIINHVIEGGVDYLVIMGTTGESVVLSKEERSEVLIYCKEINNGRVPVVLGVGGNNTLQVLEDIKSVNLTGVDAILSVSPYYNKPTQEGIYNHYKLLANQSSLPIILYNVPGRTSSNITAQTTLRLAYDFPNIVAVKEASGDMQQIMDIIKNRPSNFLVISGDDALTLPIIHMGGDGVISVIGQSFPKEYSQMVNYALENDKLNANKLHYFLYDYYQPLYADGNPAGIKALLALLGFCKPVVRPPLVKPHKETINHLKDLLN